MSYEYELKNDDLTVTLTSLGAELISVTDNDGTEYIWNADEKYWKRHTPILFPIVGKIVEGKYSIAEKEYQLPAHGFARDLEFEAERRDESTVAFALSSSLKTKTMYPFDFCLKVIYTLKGRTLDIAYEVINQDHDIMYFKIGAHPGFMCPLFKDEVIEDYYLEFEKEEKAVEILVTPDVYLANETRLFSGKTIQLNKQIFKDGPLVFSDYQSKSMSLKSRKHNKILKVTFDGFPFLGIWSTTDDASFVCIEPWHGHADYTGDSKELAYKKDVISLKAQDTFKCVHSISIS
ncbi:MAG: aldose 1-epimerase family protein [Clostridia bacterium]|jgi:galactose mutarotase-like enzyme|nr:aldose 1-epimerase family protein [Clostridia bacterium]